MESQPTLRSILRRVLRLATLPLDAREPYPSVGVALLGGASLGLLWGITARLWMRLISTRPEFSLGGTAFILLIATLFGMWSGLAWVARRRGWQGGRHYLPRGLALLFFIPFGFGGGAPLMLTVLVATLALTQGALVSIWGLAVPLTLVGVAIMGLAGELWMVVLGVLPLALMVTAWKGIARRWASNPRVQQVDRWLERLVRGALLLLAVAGVGFVAQSVATDNPGLIALLHILFYLVLLYPLFLGLRIALQPRLVFPHEEEVSSIRG